MEGALYSFFFLFYLYVSILFICSSLPAVHAHSGAVVLEFQTRDAAVACPICPASCQTRGYTLSTSLSPIDQNVY
jgi:hypothetical protein